MKYVWASWDKVSAQLSAAEKVQQVKTRHIRGYGRAVSFSSSDVVLWSSADATYDLNGKAFHTSISRG